MGKQLTQVFVGPRIPYGNTNAEGGIRSGITILFPKKAEAAPGNQS